MSLYKSYQFANFIGRKGKENAKLCSISQKRWGTFRVERQNQKNVFVTMKTFLKYHVLLIVPAFAIYTDEEKVTQNCERKVNFSV